MTDQHERECGTVEPFMPSRACFLELVDFVAGGAAAGLEHAELETRARQPGPGAAAAAVPGPPGPACGAGAAPRRGHRRRRGRPAAASKPGHARALATVFGEVTVRPAWPTGRPGTTNLHPADAELNLPAEKHSHGLRRLAAIEAARGSFDDAGRRRSTAAPASRWANGRSKQLAARAAVDFDDFYDQRRPPAADTGDSCWSCPVDGKGIVMRPDALRPATAKAAARPRAQTRRPAVQGREAQPQTPGRGRRRLRPDTRAPHPRRHPARRRRPNDATAGAAPTADDKWLTASVADDAATVIAASSTRPTAATPTTRAPGSRWWTATTTRSTGSTPRPTPAASPSPSWSTSSTSWSTCGRRPGASHREGDPAAEAWVRDKADRRPGRQGHAPSPPPSAARATTAGLDPRPTRKDADACAELPDQQGSPTWTTPPRSRHGWPIATGVIEGACRHLVKDRMDITGARWGLDRRRSHPQTPRPPQQRRLRRLLALPPRPKNATASTKPATSTTSSHRPHDVTPEEPHPNLFIHWNRDAGPSGHD